MKVTDDLKRAALVNQSIYIDDFCEIDALYNRRVLCWVSCLMDISCDESFAG